MLFFGKNEGFVNETQARSDIITTFITITIVFFGMVLAFLLLWSYNKSDKLFFMVFAGMVALYATCVCIFVAIIRSDITSKQFKIFMIPSVFMALISIIILIIFVVKSTYLFQNIDISNTRSPEPVRDIFQPQPSNSPRAFMRRSIEQPLEDTRDPVDIDNDDYENDRRF
jgi:glucan phosphoethanolaminetransferase (alkaline phosphatase superfamily)